MLKTNFRIYGIVTVLMFCLSLPSTASGAFWELKEIVGVKWDENYTFNKCNVYKIEFYAKNNEWMQTFQAKTYYRTDGENFLTRMEDAKGGYTETVLDKKNKTAIQISTSGRGSAPQYHAGKFQYPTPAELKKLDLEPTAETRQIAGFLCKKYTYKLKHIFGEVWITDQINLSNDLGIFRAAKMAAKHNTLSVDGFVMEMTTEDTGGGKTLMTTLSLQNDENYSLDLNGVKMGIFVNTVNYYLY